MLMIYNDKIALAGKYKYIGKTYGSWSNHISGGSNYPDTGEDYILQTTPNTFARKSATLGVEYDASPTIGISGTDYWAQTGGTNYVRYAIEDDPVGVRQCKSFIFSTTSSGPKSTNIRHISSYYAHTWKEMTLSVKITCSDSQSVVLELVPQYTDKSWQLYNPVAFDF